MRSRRRCRSDSDGLTKRARWVILDSQIPVSVRFAYYLVTSIWRKGSSPGSSTKKRGHTVSFFVVAGKRLHIMKRPDELERGHRNIAVARTNSGSKLFMLWEPPGPGATTPESSRREFTLRPRTRHARALPRCSASRPRLAPAT